MELNFQNKTVLVTGASSGIGQALAIAFGTSGANVIVHYHSNLQGATQAKDMIEKAGGNALLCKADITDKLQIQKMVDHVQKHFGSIDILVNNAGGAISLCKFDEMADTFFDNVMKLNLYSAFHMTRAIIHQMIDRKSGVIINISSVVARNGGGPGEVAYTTSKGALNAMTRGLAKELAKYTIRVNSVAPGPTDTPFHHGIRNRDVLEGIIPRIPLGRLGKPEDMVGAVLFLASDTSQYITGQCIEINGGFWVV